jgi:hypothetical protein
VNYSLTVFDSIFDNKTDKKVTVASWEDFEKLMFQLSKLPGYKAKKGEKKKSSSLISPAIYTEGATRANANVTGWGGWAALDVDEYDCSFEEAAGRYVKYRHICYSTASSRPEKKKFRVVFQLNKIVPADKIRHFWYALNKHFGSIGDEQTKDLSRMYYVPAQYPDSEKPSITLMDKFPAAIQIEILKHRKEQANNNTITWNSYLDCPFVNKALIKEYKSISSIDGSGRYRMIYKIMSSIACNAVKKRYPITGVQIAEMVRDLDRDTARIYQKRPLHTEADRAIEFAYKSVTF